MRLRWTKDNFGGREDLNLHDLDDRNGKTFVGYIKDKTRSPLLWVWMRRDDEDLELPDLSVDEAKKVIKAMVRLEG